MCGVSNDSSVPVGWKRSQINVQQHWKKNLTQTGPYSSRARAHISEHLLKNK